MINEAPKFLFEPITDYEVSQGENFTINLSTVYDDNNNGLSELGYNVFNFIWTEFLDDQFVVEDLGNYIFSITAPPLVSGLTPFDLDLLISDFSDDTIVSFNIVVIDNERPFAVPGTDQTIWAGDDFTIDGSLSFDIEETNLNYSWTPISQDAINLGLTIDVLDDELFVVTSPDSDELNYIFELEVEESGGGLASDFTLLEKELFISEYHEPGGTATEKFIEIFNPKLESVDLSQYEICFVKDTPNQIWNGSSNAEYLHATSKMLFNACEIIENDETNLGPDPNPETLTEDDFRFVHRELHDRLVVNQHRPFTTIPEAMNYIDTELSKIEDNNDENKEEKIKIINDYNKYLIFFEKYFSDKNAKPLKKGKDLIKQIFE